VAKPLCPLWLNILIIIILTLSPLQAQQAESELEANTSFFESILSRKRTLFVKTEVIRFLDKDGQTEFNIIYKIPNKELHFNQRQDGNYVAVLDIKFSIYFDDTVVNETSFEHLAGARSVTIAQSENHYVLDKIEFTLAKAGFRAVLEIQDKNASTTFTERYTLEPLDTNAVISDIEISHGVSTNLVPALDKFQRSQYQFYVDPVPVIDGNEKEFIAYYQVANITEKDSLYSFKEYIKVKKDDQVFYEKEYNNSVAALPHPIVLRIPIGDWQPGLYTLETKIVDNTTGKESIGETTFSLTRKFMLLTQRVFPEDDDEYALISYFLNSNQKRLWRDLSEQGRKTFIERFWASNNPNPASNENQFLDTIRTRVNEANWRFSHHRAGWRTDLGRIYLKYGQPDNINKGETEPGARYSRKPWQSWRFYATNRTYVFLDFQGNGNYRLVYVRNDDSESTEPGWQEYFGTDFRFFILDE
jgi:GWxTD domain-containing protein